MADELHVSPSEAYRIAREGDHLRDEVERLRGRLDEIAEAHAELRLIKNVRNTRHAMNLVTRIGKLARGED